MKHCPTRMLIPPRVLRVISAKYIWRCSELDGYSFHKSRCPLQQKNMQLEQLQENYNSTCLARDVFSCDFAFIAVLWKNTGHTPCCSWFPERKRRLCIH